MVLLQELDGLDDGALGRCVFVEHEGGVLALHAPEVLGDGVPDAVVVLDGGLERHVGEAEYPFDGEEAVVVLVGREVVSDFVDDGGA